MLKDRLKKHVAHHEGRRNRAYDDSEGVLSIGVGLNLREKSARERIEELEIDFEELCAGRCALTDEHIDLLFEEDIETAFADAEKYVPDFLDHPEDVQLAMLDMLFNLGGPRFRKFVKLIAALKQKNYLRAAVEMADSKWAHQVPNRAADDIALVRGCA